MGASDRVGVLIIRVWSEHPGDPAALRARLTESIDVAEVERTVTGAVTADAVCTAVRVWIERFVRHAGTGPVTTSAAGISGAGR